MGYLHLIWCLNCSESLKNGKVLIFLSVLPEKCNYSTVFTGFLLIKSVWFEIFSKIRFNSNLYMFFPLYWRKHCLSSTKNDQISPRKANELLIKYSKSAISTTIKKSNFLSACKKNWIEIFTLSKKDPYLWGVCL